MIFYACGKHSQHKVIYLIKFKNTCHEITKRFPKYCLFFYLFYPGGLPNIARSSQMVILSGYILALVCVISVYGGNLMAYLAIEKQTWPFTTLQEFADSDYGLYISNESIGLTILKVCVIIYLLITYYLCNA